MEDSPPTFNNHVKLPPLSSFAQNITPEKSSLLFQPIRSTISRKDDGGLFSPPQTPNVFKSTDNKIVYSNTFLLAPSAISRLHSLPITIPRRFSTSDIEEMSRKLKSRLRSAHSKVKAGLEHFSICDILSMYSPHDPTKKSEIENTISVKEDSINDLSVLNATPESIEMDPLEALGLIAGIFRSKSVIKQEISLAGLMTETKDQLESRAKTIFKRKLYPNLQEYTNGVWSSHLEYLDQLSKFPDSYGKLGLPLVSLERMKLILFDYEQEQKMKEYWKIKNTQFFMAHQPMHRIETGSQRNKHELGKEAFYPSNNKKQFTPLAYHPIANSPLAFNFPLNQNTSMLDTNAANNSKNTISLSKYRILTGDFAGEEKSKELLVESVPSPDVQLNIKNLISKGSSSSSA